MDRTDALLQTHAFASPSPAGRREPLASAEVGLLATAGLNLLFLPWAFGGMSFWSQAISAGLSAASFAFALAVPGRRGEFSAVRASGASRLWTFPLFWLGLTYFAIVTLQFLNPAWLYRTSTEGWHLESIPHVAWLPHGVAGTPFEPMNTWRVLLIAGSVWLTICALWVGVVRRRTAQILLTVIAANGGCVAAVLILQRISGTHRLLWLWDAPADYFAAGFIYKNHAGAFFNLVLACCLGLASWHAARAQRKLQKSHPGVLFLFLALIVFVAELFTYARAATMLGLLILAGVGISAAVRHMLQPVRSMPGSVVAILALLAASFVAVCAFSLNPEKVVQRFSRLLREDEATSVTARQLATRATLAMAGDSLVVGHGAGSFRFLFPLYQQRYPEIYSRVERAGNKTVTKRLYWEHAHDDYAETLAEYGLVGSALVLGVVISAGVAMVRSRLFSRRPLLIVLAGPAAMLANAAVDFPFRNPAVLLTGIACTILALRWAQLEPASRPKPGALRT